jgi:adenylate kinase
MQSIESYLEDNQVYELFENLLKQLVINRPEQPLDFLIQKLSKPERKYLFRAFDKLYLKPMDL